MKIFDAFSEDLEDEEESDIGSSSVKSFPDFLDESTEDYVIGIYIYVHICIYVYV
jgi:hypothetical protein